MKKVINIFPYQATKKLNTLLIHRFDKLQFLFMLSCLNIRLTAPIFVSICIINIFFKFSIKNNILLRKKPKTDKRLG